MAAAHNLAIILSRLPRDEEILLWPLGSDDSPTKGNLTGQASVGQFKALLFELGLIKFYKNSLCMVKSMEKLHSILLITDAPFDVILNQIKIKNKKNFRAP